MEKLRNRISRSRCSTPQSESQYKLSEIIPSPTTPPATALCSFPDTSLASGGFKGSESGFKSSQVITTSCLSSVPAVSTGAVTPKKDQITLQPGKLSELNVASKNRHSSQRRRLLPLDETGSPIIVAQSSSSPSSSGTSPTTRDRQAHQHQDRSKRIAIAEEGTSSPDGVRKGSLGQIKQGKQGRITRCAECLGEMFSTANFPFGKKVNILNRLKPKVEEGGDEEGPEETVTRWRPESKLDALSKETKFSRKELQYIYRGFKQECPSGMMTEEEFKDIYTKLFPMGDCTQYARYIFSTLDHEREGVVSFGTVIRALSLIFRGTLHDRIRWLFSLYDVNRDGYISRADISDVMASIYELLGTGHTVPPVEESTCQEHVDRVFQKLSRHGNDFISEEEFLEYCMQDHELQESLEVFTSVMW